MKDKSSSKRLMLMGLMTRDNDIIEVIFLND